MLSAGLNTVIAGNWASSTPMNSPSLCWIPSLIPETTNRISPFNSLAASVKVFTKSLSESSWDLNKTIAAFFYPKIGSIYSSENSIRVGTAEPVSHSTTGLVSQLDPSKITGLLSNFLNTRRAGVDLAPYAVAHSLSCKWTKVNLSETEAC